MRKALCGDVRGATLVEYLIAVGVIGIAALVSTHFFGDTVSRTAKCSGGRVESLNLGAQICEDKAPARPSAVNAPNERPNALRGPSCDPDGNCSGSSSASGSSGGDPSRPRVVGAAAASDGDDPLSVAIDSLPDAVQAAGEAFEGGELTLNGVAGGAVGLGYGVFVSWVAGQVQKDLGSLFLKGMIESEVTDNPTNPAQYKYDGTLALNNTWTMQLHLDESDAARNAYRASVADAMKKSAKDPNTVSVTVNAPELRYHVDPSVQDPQDANQLTAHVKWIAYQTVTVTWDGHTRTFVRKIVRGTYFDKHLVNN
jgi:hypothetical protein